MRRRVTDELKSSRRLLSTTKPIEDDHQARCRSRTTAGNTEHLTNSDVILSGVLKILHVILLSLPSAP